MINGSDGFMKLSHTSDHVRFTWPPMLALLAVCTLLFGCASGESFVKPGLRLNQLGKIGVVVSDQSDALNAVQSNEVADLFAMHLLRKRICSRGPCES